MRVVVRWRTARSRLARFVTGSLAAHAVLAAVILVLPMMRPAPQTFDDAMVVALAGPLPGPPAASAPAAARPSAPAPAPPPPKAPEPKEAHAVKEIPKPKPSPVPKKKEEKKDDAPVRSPTPSAPPGPPADEAKEEPPGTGESKGGGVAGATGPTGVTAVLGGGDASLGFYGATVKAALESAWIKPPLEDQGETYSATVMFVIARDGTVRDARISEPSGVPSLDRSVLRAVLEASPFPPIPPSWQGDSLPATMRFDLNPEGR